ncbi:MAG: DUF4258 domain-containing protein [bacterium]|nr:DUF4258 domain-containing protein [bacterium]
MRYFFTRHALERMEERSISKKIIDSAFAKPTKVSYDYNNLILIKKQYKRRGTDRLLMIVGKLEKGDFKIITIIETSKIRKYL